MARPESKKDLSQKGVTQRLVVGMSGASGAAYGIRLLEACRELGLESHLVMTGPAEMTIGYETSLKPKTVAAKADYHYGVDDIAAPISSGGFKTLGMIVAPCSVKAMSEIATGVTTTLLTRAADVCLKERRTLVLMVRETPLHKGHLDLMSRAADCGAIILPPMPAFYDKPQTLMDIVHQGVGRALDLVGIEHTLGKRWAGHAASGPGK